VSRANADARRSNDDRSMHDVHLNVQLARVPALAARDITATRDATAK
jgi:hypothetical protein